MWAEWNRELVTKFLSPKITSYMSTYCPKLHIRKQKHFFKYHGYFKIFQSFENKCDVSTYYRQSSTRCIFAFGSTIIVREIATFFGQSFQHAAVQICWNCYIGFFQSVNIFNLNLKILGREYCNHNYIQSSGISYNSVSFLLSLLVSSPEFFLSTQY